jgi:thiamine-phosphate pyrophosphorylase
LKSLCDRLGNPLFVNGRLDVALLLNAHLHLPSGGLHPRDVRSHLDSRWISVAVHSEDEAQMAEGADLALVSPVFVPGSKQDLRPPLGPEGFSHLSSRLPCPAYALGGLTPERARAVPSATGFAAISSILLAANPLERALEFLARNAKNHQA